MSKEATNNNDKLDEIALNYIPTEQDKEAFTEKELEVLREAEFPWEKALDTYDPEFPNYTPSGDAIEFFTLLRIVHGQDFTVANSKAHYFMIDTIFNNVTSDMFPYSPEVNRCINIDPDRYAICASRGLSKSTVVTNFLPIYVALKGRLPGTPGKQRFWLMFGASSRGHARSMALAIKSICEDSKYMQSSSVIEHFRATETEIEWVRAGKGSERERYFILRFMGINTPSRGQKNRYNDRPNGAMLDDVIPGEAAAYSPVIMSNLNMALHSDIGNSLVAKNGKIINIFTPFTYTDECTKTILNGSYTPLLLPVSSAFPDPNNVKKSDIHSSWPQMHTTESIYNMWKRAKKSGTLRAFMQERMLRLSSAANQLVPDSCIQWCNVKPIIKNIEMYNVYITTDYTTTSGEGSDFSGIAMWAVSNNKDWFLLDLVLKKMGMKEQYTRTLDMAARMKRLGAYVEIGVEIDGNQAAHVYSLEEEMMKRGDFYTFARDKNNPGSDRKGIISRSSGVKKHERFRIAVADTLLQKKMWFPEHLKDSNDMKEFIAQIKGATHEGFTRHDDGPDLVSQLCLIYIILPSGSVDKVNKLLLEDRSGIWGYIEDDEKEVEGFGEIF